MHADLEPVSGSEQGAPDEQIGGQFAGPGQRHVKNIAQHDVDKGHQCRNGHGEHHHRRAEDFQVSVQSVKHQVSSLFRLGWIDLEGIAANVGSAGNGFSWRGSHESKK